MSCVSASAFSDAASPLVGMRFVGGETGGSAAAGVGAGAGAPKERSRPNSWSAQAHQGRGVPLIGVRGPVPLPLAVCGVGRAMQGEAEAVVPVPACRAPVTMPVAGGVPPAVVGEEPSFEGGVGGRRGKRPRRYFFP